METLGTVAKSLNPGDVLVFFRSPIIDRHDLDKYVIQNILGDGDDVEYIITKNPKKSVSEIKIAGNENKEVLVLYNPGFVSCINGSWQFN